MENENALQKCTKISDKKNDELLTKGSYSRGDTHFINFLAKTFYETFIKIRSLY